jgi:flagellar hook-length control protein FliK
MMPKSLTLLDRGLDSLPLSDAIGPCPETGGPVGAEGVDGTRPRSAFAELMSTTVPVRTAEAAAEQVPDTGAGTPSSDAEPEPFAPGFDLPAFLQVLPRSGNEVAVAAAREPGIAAAVRRLATATPRPEARTVDAPDVAIRLPSFLVPPKGELPASPPIEDGGAAPALPATVGVTANRVVAQAIGAGAVAETVGGPAAVTDHALSPSAPRSTTATASSPRTATQALESALRRVAPPIAASKDDPQAPAKAAPVVTAPLDAMPAQQPAQTPAPLSTATQSSVFIAAGQKPTRSTIADRKEPGARAEAAGRAQREPVRAATSALLNILQREPGSPVLRSGADDRGDHPGRSAVPAVDMASTLTAAGVGIPLDPSSPQTTTASGDPSLRSAQAAVSLRQPVGTEAWQDELSAQLSFMAEQGEGSEAVMKLAPEELGELEVRVEVRDGEAALQFGVLNADARQAVEAAQSRLRELFSSQGMNISEFRVFSNLSGDPQSTSNGGRGASPNPRPAMGAEGDLEVVVRPRRSVGVLDLYA